MEVGLNWARGRARQITNDKAIQDKIVAMLQRGAGEAIDTAASILLLNREGMRRDNLRLSQKTLLKIRNVILRDVHPRFPVEHDGEESHES